MQSLQKLHIGMVIIILVLAFGSQSLWAHCQIPCGIYTDEMRFKMIEEDITTIENFLKTLSFLFLLYV